jgi:hypothetical protein
MPRRPVASIEPTKERYFRALENIAHILVNEDGPAVNCRRRRDALAILGP